jgi:hypothetical protein
MLPKIPTALALLSLTPLVAASFGLHMTDCKPLGSNSYVQSKVVVRHHQQSQSCAAKGIPR